VLAAVAFIDRLETNITAGALPLLQAEWGFSDTLGGAIPAAAAVATLLLVLPGGWLADRRRRTGILTVVVASWAVFSVGTALAVSFAMFFGMRILLGAADTIDTPAAQSLLADYHPSAERATAYGLYRVAYFAGIPAGVFVGGVVGQTLGWRAAYLLVAGPALAVAALCRRLPEPPRGATDQPRGPVLGQPARLRQQARRLARIRTLVLLHVGVGALFFGLSGIIFWLPSFYQRVYGLGEATAGAYAAAVTFFGVLGGSVVGGAVGDRWHGRLRGWRVTVAAAGLIAGTPLLALAFAAGGVGGVGGSGAPGPPGAPVAHLGTIVAGMLLMSLAIPTLSAAVADVTPAGDRGLAFAGLQLVGTVGTVGGPLVVGIAADATGSLAGGLQLLVLPIAAGSLVVLYGRGSADADTQRACGSPSGHPRATGGSGATDK
jgi:MFS family permease